MRIKHIALCGCGKKRCRYSVRCRTCENKSRKGRLHINVSEDNPNWKGEDAGLGAIHRWVEARKSKPALCENCMIDKPCDLANVSGKYIRDINDFKWLCRKCHMREDGRLRNLIQYSGGDYHAEYHPRDERTGKFIVQRK